MKGNTSISFRATAEEMNYIKSEMARLKEETGLRASRSDVIRMGLLTFKKIHSEKIATR